MSKVRQHSKLMTPSAFQFQRLSTEMEETFAGRVKANKALAENRLQFDIKIALGDLGGIFKWDEQEKGYLIVFADGTHYRPTGNVFRSLIRDSESKKARRPAQRYA